jgi:hypothetical protein
VVRELFPGLGDIGFLVGLGHVGSFLPASSKFEVFEKREKIALKRTWTTPNSPGTPRIFFPALKSRMLFSASNTRDH